MKYYHSLLCVSEIGQQFVYKIKPQKQNKNFVSALARSLLPKFRAVFIVHSEIALAHLRSTVRGNIISAPKVISVF
jgi:hypothetical protein